MSGVRTLFKAIIMGPPGSGKGTISERIVKDFALRHMASGDILRHHVSKGTDVGKVAKQHMDAGGLVPDDVMVKLIMEEINGLKSSWLLDGFPRSVDQAKELQKHVHPDVVINLNVPFDVIISRIKGRWVHLPSGRVYHTEFNPPQKAGLDDVTGEKLIQREDDKEETVKRRLEAYKDQTAPVLRHFDNHGLLTNFAGSYTNELWPLVHKFLASKTTALQYTDYGTAK